MNLFRIHIKPGGGNSAFSFAYCLDEQVLGVGWQTYSEKRISTWEEYESEAKLKHTKISKVRYLKNNVRKDDLIWTRNRSGEYYLAKVDSEWEYLTSIRACEADIVNVVRCKILKVPSVDDTPGKVVACFRASGTMQRIRDESAVIYSQYLWNILSQSNCYQFLPSQAGNVFSFLTSEQAEDIIFIYLQTKGWIVIPHSRKADTMAYEFVLIHGETKERAVVQVKTGHTPLNTNEWRDATHKVFLFQTDGNYLGGEHRSVVCVQPAEILAFMQTHRALLPSSISHWLDMHLLMVRETNGLGHRAIAGWAS